MNDLIAGQPVKVRPAEGVRVRDESGALLSAERDTAVHWNPYWARKLNDEDITVEPISPTKKGA